MQGIKDHWIDILLIWLCTYQLGVIGMIGAIVLIVLGYLIEYVLTRG